MTRRERLEAKMERRAEWADKARAKAAGRFETAHAIADRIPFGQPILVGHHSEAHARRDQDRIHANMSKACELSDLAGHHASKVDGLARQLDRSIFSDDDDAVAALETRIAEREAECERHAAINKAWRKTSGTAEERAAAIVASGVCSEKLATEIARTMRRCPYLDKPLSTTNTRALIRADRERIETIKARQARAEAAEKAGGVSIEEIGEWVRVTFAEKPSRDVLDALKAAGFRWGGGTWCGRRESLPECVR